jgi:hypothetical protein
MGRKLVVYMIDGTDYGPRTVEIGNWVGKAFYSNRASLPKVLGRWEMDNPGIYFLKSRPTNNAFAEHIYIGEAESIGVRLKQQLDDPKRDFEEILFFVSKDDLLTKAHIKYLEAKLIEMAHEARSAEIENVHRPSFPALHEAEISDLEYFLEQIKLVLPLMSFKFLIPTAVHIGQPDVESKPEYLYQIKSNNLEAYMFENERGYIVKKDSQANKNMAPAVNETYKDLQRKLIAGKLLISQGKHFVFAEDTVFASPSAAANIILGRQTPGPLMWLDKDGKTFKEIHE